LAGGLAILEFAVCQSVTIPKSAPQILPKKKACAIAA
jgi:hypothetical protein